jgi:hypothetical protein
MPEGRETNAKKGMLKAGMSKWRHHKGQREGNILYGIVSVSTPSGNDNHILFHLFRLIFLIVNFH